MSMPLTGQRVLISGAGVAGPALAYWLGRYGADATVVEIAPALRTSGFAVDFRGPTHLGVLKKMGVLDELRAVQTHGGEMRVVDENGRLIFEMPAEFAGGDIEVYRRDLSRVLYERSAGRAEYRFGDAIAALADAADGVHVDFNRGASQRFDLVIGADGMISGVRRLAFGPEQRYVRHLGYYLAGWDMPNALDVDTVPQMYNVPGRMAGIGADRRDPARAGAQVVFAAPLVPDYWQDPDRQKALIAKTFGDLGWYVPALLDGLRQASELYFDSISRVSVPTWVTGRVALLGDAAWGVTLGGMGVGTGLVGAYVLAGELAVAHGDHRAGFAAYQRRMRPYAARWQRGTNTGKLLAPATALGLWTRNNLLRTRLVRKMLISSTKAGATDQAMPDYGAA